jgi:hypothetical protein
MTAMNRDLLKLAQEGMRNADRDYMRWARVEKLARSRVKTEKACDSANRSIGYRSPSGDAMIRGREKTHTIVPVWKLSIFSVDGRTFQACIDDNKPFHISAMQSLILKALAMATPRSDDGLVEWKSFGSIIAAICAATGKKTYDRRALSTAIWRLRSTLMYHGWDPGLIQTNSLTGAYRFAVRQKAAQTINEGS